MASASFRGPVSRRGFLTVGTIGLGGLTLADFFRLEARADLKNYEAIAAKADSVIHIFLPGGIAHQETFDPKPFAPIEYRGEMGSVETKIEGEQFSETLPQTAQVADKLTVIRSMTHGEAAHERGTHNMFTGLPAQPGPAVPEHGERRLARVRPAEQPAAVRLRPQPAQRLRRHGLPQLVASRRSAWAATRPTRGFQVQDLNLPGGIDEPRFATRRNVLDAVNDHFAKQGEERRPRRDGHLLPAGLQPDQLAEGPRGVQHQRRAGQDPRRVRPQRRRPADADGPPARRRRASGSSRSTTAAGTSTPRSPPTCGPRCRPSTRRFSALIRDLDRTGLLDRTLVMVSSEFGRTPKINKDAGRDHWPKVFSVVLAGGGIKKGYIHGASNATATEPERDPIGPEDLATTVYHQLGIVADKELMAPGNRPIEIVDGGKVLKELLA